MLLFCLLASACDADVGGGGEPDSGGDARPDALSFDASRADLRGDGSHADGVSSKDSLASPDGIDSMASLDALSSDTASADAMSADGLSSDAAAPDLMAADLALSPDTLSPDMLSPDMLSPDTLSPDTLSPDTLSPDTLSPDTAPPKPDGPPNTTGLSVPCQNGPGWTLFRFHYGGGNKSAQIDVWDASCSYSFAPNSACNVREVYPGFGSVSYTSQGYPIFTTTQYLRVRFSAAGLSFSKAKVYLQARSYATSSSTNFRVWSPLYGQQIGGPVDNDWVYDWYGVDWTGYLYPSDKPSLTAIQVYAQSGKLAVKAVELCVNP
jgi:hypothetical protein